MSFTTPPPRPGEVDGLDYRFVSPATFTSLVGDGAFLEWAEVYGHRYGTLAGPIVAALDGGRSVVLEIDMQGAAAVRERVPDAVLVFLTPPSLEELERRLRARGTESEAALERRLGRARAELDQSAWFDHVVVNDEVGRAAAEVAAIIEHTPPA